MSMRFTTSASILFLAFVSSGAVAFCFPLPATVDVIPWVPTPQQHAILFIKDITPGSLCNGYGQLVNLQVTQQGNVITIHADVTEGPPFISQVDLGTLPAGRYTVNYSSRASMDFSVSAQGYASAIEYFAPSLGHYFVTSDSGEIEALDNGVIPGWTRTGESFQVIPTGTRPTTALSVCRFYGLPQAGLDTHFLTASQTECQAIQIKYPGVWLLETPKAFAVPIEGTSQQESCPDGTIPLYRLYDNRPDAGHRYTASEPVRDVMIETGWILEGNGSTDNHVMCIPG